MKGLGRKASFLAVMAVMATALVGAAYTLWYEDLELKASITTGELDVTWTVMFCRENEDADEVTGSNFDDGFVWYAKEVGSFTKTSVPTGGIDALALTISTGYPGYAVDCKLDFQNVGTVPIHVEREIFDFDLDNDGQYDDGQFECTANVSQPDCRNTSKPWASTDDAAPIYVRWVNGLGCQLHPGDRSSGDLFIGVRQPAAEATTYRLRYTVVAHQWNESAWNGCASPRPQ